MGLDAILKRYFPVVICLFIATAAYFQASGMGQLVAGSVLLDPSAQPPPPASPKSGGSNAPAGAERSTNAAPILARNPFDSVTGPLDGTSQAVALPTPEAEPVDTSNPYNDPQCDAAKCLLITQSDDPDWSFASIAGSDGKSQLRRRGDEVGTHTVYWIGWDRVWLVQGGSRCQMIVHGDKSKVAAAAPATPSPAEPPSTSKKSRASKVPPEIAAKIHKISETQYDIERSVVDQVLENQAELMRSARIVPEKEGDKVVGIRLFGVRPDSLLGTLGLENGDRLQSINGFEMSDPQKALEAYARLRSADKLAVSINRRGKPMTIDFSIK